MAMQQLKWILSAVMVLGAMCVSQAQGFRVWQKSGSPSDYGISLVDSVTFGSGSMKVWRKGTTAVEHLTSNVDSLTFTRMSTMTDIRDGKLYKTVQIGTKVWMAENLNYGEFVSDNVTQYGVQKYCYDNDQANCATDGGLYQWHTAMGIASTYASSSYTVPSGHV
jgi:hypothetical protein